MSISEKKWVLELTDGFRVAAVVGTAAELGVFEAIPEQGITADELASRLACSIRGIQVLCDALAGLSLLEKRDGTYFLPPKLRPVLRESGAETVIPMLQHRMNMMRGWANLPWTVKAGIPAPRTSSIRGPAADLDAFIMAMNVVSRDVADDLVRQLQPLQFRRMLDVGAGPGTWSHAFLRAVPEAKAVLFDLPHAIALARRQAEELGLVDRMEFVVGNFYVDELPQHVDFAWVSAIAHQNSREQNRQLFEKVFRALEPGGQIAIRDIVLEPDRTAPLEGALFAVNMLVGTPAGGTYTLEEFREDLLAAGFSEPHLRIRSDNMNSVILAHRR
jgi:ubiquinone/menaquinone biosynthesis C-methylase UbiE